jgi:hypothetical protein
VVKTSVTTDQQQKEHKMNEKLSDTRFVLSPSARSKIITSVRYAAKPGYFLRASDMFPAICEGAEIYLTRVAQGAKINLVLDSKQCWDGAKNMVELSAGDFLEASTGEPMEIIGNKYAEDVIEIKKRGY